MKILLQGFLLGIAYVAPIGMQNMYVINSAINKTKMQALTVAFFTILFDIGLAMSCYFGIGLIIEKFPITKLFLLGIGGIAVLVIGIKLLLTTENELTKVDVKKPLKEIILTCFLVTWLNPQAIIDGTVLLSGFRATFIGNEITLFILGVCLASTTWFFGLVLLTAKFKDVFSIKVVNIINKLCGILIIFFGLKLLYLFIKFVF